MSETPSFDEVKATARQAIRAAEEAYASREQARLVAALQQMDGVLKGLPEEKTTDEGKAPDPADPLAPERAGLWLWRGRILVMADQPQVVAQGLHSLDQAIARLRVAPPQPAVHEALINAWIQRAGGLFRLEQREAIAEAVRSYDQAISLLEQVPEAARGTALGICLMNRGVGLMHLDSPRETKEATAARLADAAKSLERATQVLAPVAAAGDRAAQHNLASTWSNLGMLRSRLGDAAGAVEGHRNSVNEYRGLVRDANDAGETFELAARLFNLGQACGVAGQTNEALAAGREALVHAGLTKTSDPQARELTLRIRHGLCVVLGGLIAASGGKKDDPERAARLEEASDLVEDGLAELNAWIGERTPGVQDASARLFEFGAWLYRTQQPQFLAEYLLEFMGGEAVRAQIASAAVQQARQALVQGGFAQGPSGEMDRVLDILQELGEVEKRVKELQAPVATGNVQ